VDFAALEVDKFLNNLSVILLRVMTYKKSRTLSSIMAGRWL